MVEGWQWAEELLRPGGIALKDWDKNTHAWSLYSIEGSPYGLAACNETRRAHFSYQLSFRGKLLKLNAIPKTVAWDMAQNPSAEAFHALCAPGQRDRINVLIVLIDKHKCVDFPEMERCTKNPDVLPTLPEEMLRIAYTLGRLTAWEDDIAKYAATTPGPSPLKMHAVFDGVLYSDGEDTEFQALQFLGKLVLKCVAFISMYCKHGSDTVQQLESRVQELTDPARLAIMMHQSMLPWATREVRNATTAAHMLE